ncbi:unnamed protein product [Amoebophrya sp. A120]|nr:unnamed protein product [Amoebophrya sp. A120]|eukprot:GSA120T00016031001.1
MGNLISYSAASSPQEQVFRMREAAGERFDSQNVEVPRNKLLQPFDDQFYTGVKQIAAASLAASTASVILNPFDVVKVRLQVQNQLQMNNQMNNINGYQITTPKYYKSTLHALQRIAIEDGVIHGLWLPGLTASVCRDVINGGLRVGIYPMVKDLLHDQFHDPTGRTESPTIAFLSGILTGMFGSFCANPFDLIKVRFQVENGRLERCDPKPRDQKMTSGFGSFGEKGTNGKKNVNVEKINLKMKAAYPSYPYNPPPSLKTIYESVNQHGGQEIVGTMNQGGGLGFSSEGNAAGGGSSTSSSNASPAGHGSGSGAARSTTTGKMKYDLRWYSTLTSRSKPRLDAAPKNHKPRPVSTATTTSFLRNLLPKSKQEKAAEFFLHEQQTARYVYTTGLYQGSEPQFKNTLEAFQGLQADKLLFRGVMPNMLRASIVTAAQITSYDWSKKYLIHEKQMDQNWQLFTLCGLISGFCSSVLSTPVDLVKTRVMNDRPIGLLLGQEREGYQFRSTKKCFFATVNKEGVLALYKGFAATFLRLGPHFMLGWPLLEFFRTRVFGLDYF